MNAMISDTIKAAYLIRHADSRDSCAAQVCFVSVPRPQVAQNCGAYSFNARIRMLTEMYRSYQYVSSDPNKVCPVHFSFQVAGALQSSFAAYISPTPLGSFS